MSAVGSEIVSLPEAWRRESAGWPWRVRLVFQGENRANVSGRSDKWWEAERVLHGQGPSTYAVRWGATGTNGQSGTASSGNDALRRAESKVAKGYVETLTAPVRPVVSLQDLVDRATWRFGEIERAFFLAGEHGLVALSLGIDVWLRPRAERLAVVPYVAADGSLWGMAPEPTGIYYALLRR